MTTSGGVVAPAVPLAADALAGIVACASPLAGDLGDVVGLRIVAAAKRRINRVLPRAVAQSNDDAAAALACNACSQRQVHVRKPMPDLLAGWPGTWPVIASAGPAVPRGERGEPAPDEKADKDQDVDDVRVDADTGGNEMHTDRTS